MFAAREARGLDGTSAQRLWASSASRRIGPNSAPTTDANGKPFARVVAHTASRRNPEMSAITASSASSRSVGTSATVAPSSSTVKCSKKAKP